MRDPVRVLGALVDPVTRAEAVRRVGEFIESGGPHLVVTADASALIIARRDAEFGEILQQASLVTADGAGVVRALKAAGRPVPERCSGCDLIVDIAREAAGRGWSLFFLGAAPGVAEAAVENLKRQFPDLKVAGVRDGYFTDDDEVVSQVRQASPDVLLVAMGMPKQEKWFWRHRERLGAKVAMGVGGSFDVLSGAVRRAPEFYQKHGLEWLYRFACAPRKSSRKMLMLPVFAGLLIADSIRRRRARSD
jgi:N-acetylglucosaminyldiphosphoundecaprenol N-acetyl-beta-D-mannosaminyltransferase